MCQQKNVGMRLKDLNFDDQEYARISMNMMKILSSIDVLSQQWRLECILNHSTKESRLACMPTHLNFGTQLNATMTWSKGTTTAVCCTVCRAKLNDNGTPS